MNSAAVLPDSPPRSARIPALDVVRGVAIIGTLGTNIWLFSHPWGLLGMLTSPVLETAGDSAGAAQLVLMALTQGKFLALLTLTFGIGLAIQHDAAEIRGSAWPGRYLWRAALLFLDGVINYVLIAEFDVLMGYAVTAVIVAWLLLTRPRTQSVLIVVLGFLHVLLISAIVLFVASEPTTDGGGMTLEGDSPYATESFIGLALFRLQNAAVFRAEPVLIGLLSLAMFLIGARLYRAGLFAPDRPMLRRKLMIIGALAVPVDLVLGIAGGIPGLLAERYLVAPFVALGILGVVAEVCDRRGVGGWFARRTAELGRVALSAYVLQNLLGGLLFYGWGLGLAEVLAEWRVPVTVGAFALIVSVVVALAHLWLRRFALGPVEWLWKAAADVGRPRSSRPSGG